MYIKDAYIQMDPASCWTATADSNVTLVGPVNANQIDAMPGVAVTATIIGGKARLESCKLPSGGELKIV